MSYSVDELRSLLKDLPTDHDADGEHKPKVGEVFAPEQHAAALAPSTLVVVGARGAGKSFWAGVLGQDDTRLLAARVYPKLGLSDLIVEYVYNGYSSGTAGSGRSIVHALSSLNHLEAVDFWLTAILRAAFRAVGDHRAGLRLHDLTSQFASDPDRLDEELRKIDARLDASGKTCMVIFDALDRLAHEWGAVSKITDALFEACWELRVFKRIKAKIFIRPDQLNNESLKFVELPKIRSGRVELLWSRTDLYGVLFSRMFEQEVSSGSTAFQDFSLSLGAPAPSDPAKRIRSWSLSSDEVVQKKAMERMAGPFMGRAANKGATYPWAYNHLEDGNGVVTPRSFIKLFTEAARHKVSSSTLVITPDAIRHGLRQASKTRVEQLEVEYPWIRRALAPLAGLRVPCQSFDLHTAWNASDTAETISHAASAGNFLAPRSESDKLTNLDLEAAMVKIGVISYRPDGRVDIPDLFRIAARMLKLGGVSLKEKR